VLSTPTPLRSPCTEHPSSQRRSATAYRIEVDVDEPLAGPEEEDEQDEEREALLAGLAKIRADLEKVKTAVTPAARVYTETARYIRARSMDDEDLVAALTSAVEKAGKPSVLASEVADELATGDRALPVAHWASNETATLLGRARLAGLVVQYRRNGRYGTSLWGLPGSDSGQEGYEPVLDKYAKTDKATLTALRKAVKNESGQVRIGAVLEQLGLENPTPNKKSLVASSLIRLVWRRQAINNSPRNPMKWGLA
jgi:hypothetical protein